MIWWTLTWWVCSILLYSKISPFSTVTKAPTSKTRKVSSQTLGPLDHPLEDMDKLMDVNQILDAFCLQACSREHSFSSVPWTAPELYPLNGSRIIGSGSNQFMQTRNGASILLVYICCAVWQYVYDQPKGIHNRLCSSLLFCCLHKTP